MNRMASPLLICPGVHDPGLTFEFLEGMAIAPSDVYLFSGSEPYSPLAVLAFLQRSIQLNQQESFAAPSDVPPLRIIAFSAGVVGAMGAAYLWQSQGGRVQWMLALDGWGMPVWAPFPVYRLSHDRFTHESSKLLGGSLRAFYADPPVEHRVLWRSPHLVSGWQTWGWGLRSRATAASFMQELLRPSE